MSAFESLDEIAMTALRSGLCVLPPAQDGTKMPKGPWKEYQTRTPTPQQVAAWYSNGRTGLGFVCGSVSGNLEMLEFEGRAVAEGLWDQFKANGAKVGLGPLITRIAKGYGESTPRGGIHLLYRCAELVAGNTKLAERPATEEELVEDPNKRRTLIETRGEGGYVVVAPSHGTVHPTGKPWSLLSGDVQSIVTISAEEREALWDLARSFNQMPIRAEPPVPTSRAKQDGRPGDDFNARARWADILQPNGWAYLFTASDGNQHWRRPGKRIGNSATVGNSGEGPFYVFSTSTPFDSERAYSKFSAFAILDHGGDFKAAARALGDQGYGDRTAEIRGTTEPIPPTPPASTLPAFPVEVLPEAARVYVERLAEGGLPLEFLGPIALGVMAGAIGGLIDLEIAAGSWTEPLIVWYALIGLPGTGKSPSIQALRGPLDAIEQPWREQYRYDMAMWRQLAAQERAGKPRPQSHRLVVGNHTFEKLIRILVPRVNEAGVIQLVDELRSAIAGLGQYKRGGGSDRPDFLSLWSGTPISYDRVTDDVEIYVARPAVSIIGGIQPHLLHLLDGDDGLRDRFCLSCHQGYPTEEPPRIAKAYAEAEGWSALLEKLAKKRDMRRTRWLSDEALELFEATRTRFRKVQTRSETPEHLASWASKAPAHLARHALLLSEADYLFSEHGSIPLTAMERAANVVSYFEAHCQALPIRGENLMIPRYQRDQDQAVDALAAFARRPADKRVTRRDVGRARVGGARTPAEVDLLIQRYRETYPGCVSEVAASGNKTVAVYAPGHQPAEVTA